MTLPAPSLEPAIRALGEELARLSEHHAPSLFERRWWSQAAINLTVQDPTFKTQLFRFIDVLPSVADEGRLVGLAEEYFGSQGTQVFGLRWGLKALAATGIGAKLTGHAIRSQVEQMARSFIAGSSIDDALPVLTDLWKDSKAWSVDLLGEATISASEADRYRDRCIEALRGLVQASADWSPTPLLEQDHLGSIPRTQLSLKISALSPHLDPIDPAGSYDSVAPRLRAIVDLAMAKGASLIFDMEQAESKELLLELFMRLFGEPAYRAWPNAGLALQAYHRSSGEDVDRLLNWVRQRGTPITIRLVKGAYWDSDTIRYRQRGWPIPLFEQKHETDVQYEALVHRLLAAHRLVRPAFGTHNLRTLAYIEAVADSLKLTPAAWEYQMIFGMAEPFQQAILRRGRRLRLYTPVGDMLPGMAYLVRRLLENTSNESFLRKEYVESQPLAVLLAPPQGRLSGSVQSAMVEPASFRNEPLRDFSQAPVRAAYTQAIESVRRELGRDWRLRDDGQVRTGKPMRLYNPAHPDQLVGSLASASLVDVEPAVDRASAAWPAWREMPAERRAEVLIEAARLFRAKRDYVAAWEIFECGKPWREADADLAEAIDFLEFYAQEAYRLCGPKRLGRYPGELNEQSVAPRGLTGVIAPWNFPLAIPAGMVSAALVTGNPVLFKPSERSPLIGRILVETLYEAGVPEELLVFLPGGPEIGRALVCHPEVATLAFTGSRAVGLAMVQEAAEVTSGQRMVKRVIAEMGGKNAIIVDDTADLDEAITGIVTSFTGYAGQKCSACSRAVVHRAVYDLFLERLKEAVLSLQIGDPADPGTQVGPVIDERAQARVLEYVKNGMKEGRLLVEGPVAQPGWYVGPTVIADVAPTARIAQEEIFGPVLAVMPAASFDEALELANATDYALTGGVYSRSPVNLERARQGFDVGNLYLNRPITGALVGRQPFGGHRYSGVGAKAGGEDYLRQFVITKVVSEQTLRRGFAPAE